LFPPTMSFGLPSAGHQLTTPDGVRKHVGVGVGMGVNVAVGVGVNVAVGVGVNVAVGVGVNVAVGVGVNVAVGVGSDGVGVTVAVAVGVVVGLQRPALPALDMAAISSAVSGRLKIWTSSTEPMKMSPRN